MNNLLRTALRINSLRSVLNPVRNVLSNANHQGQVARSLWYLTNSRQESKFISVKTNNSCQCGGCGKCGTHTKAAQRELVEFLTEEILAERKAQKAKTIPAELDGFKAKLNGAEVTLTKKVDGEEVIITFNVNHTVDTDVEPEVHANMDKPEIGELKSKPSFKIELKRGNTTITVLCSFIEPAEQEEGYNDIFGIDEISIYEGEWHENVYAVSGEVVDSYLYDLIMNYLEEKGISNEFVEKLAEYSTIYEHSAYISLLEGLSKYASGK